MITIPENFSNNPFVDRKFVELVAFFNKLEQELQCPNYEDAKRILARAQNQLIMDGVL